MYFPMVMKCMVEVSVTYFNNINMTRRTTDLDIQSGNVTNLPWGI